MSHHRWRFVGRRGWQLPTRALMAAAIVACAVGSRFSAMGSRPPEIAGLWIDSSLTTADDTLAMELGLDGVNRSLVITVERDANHAAVTRQRQSWRGYWYLSGDIGDTTHRELCFRENAREGGTCLRFRVDTLVGTSAQTRRRLVIYGQRDQPSQGNRVLMERKP
jgi:hypothetical protein